VQVVFIVVNEPDMLQDVLTGLLEMGITRATILESQGMGRAVMDRLSIFAGFRDLWSGNLGYSHTLFAVVEDEIVEELGQAIKDVMADHKSSSKGVFFSFPVGTFISLSD
jgi:nitrogen regulatory protein PII